MYVVPIVFIGGLRLHINIFIVHNVEIELSESLCVHVTFSVYKA